MTDGARHLLDDVYAAELRGIRETYDLRVSQRRASGDVADVARAASFGLVDTVLVDIDEVVPGRVDEATGGITIDDADARSTTASSTRSPAACGCTAARCWPSAADDIPGNGSVAAILRYAP